MFRTVQKLAMFSLTRGLIILEESVCQHYEVGCQLVSGRSCVEGLPRQHLPFMVFKYHSASQANNSTELRRMLNSKSSVWAGSEKHQIPAKPLKARLRFTHRYQAWKKFCIFKCFWCKQIQLLPNLKLTMLSNVKLRHFIRQKIAMKTHICLSVKCLCLRPGYNIFCEFLKNSKLDL